jgi:hypothetical protein
VEYVMVPVPEELAEAVLTFLRWKDQAKAAQPTDVQSDVGDAVARVFARLDDPSRALLAVIASAVLDEEELGIPEAARRVGVTAREALGIILEVNNILVGEGCPPISFGGRDVGALPGEFTWESFTAVMPEAIAVHILGLDRTSAPG